MRLVGMNPVVVHGGGPQITDLMAKLGKESTFVDGLRVTDAETVDIVRMALLGKVNREVVGAINRHGPYAIGFSGEDAGLVTVRQRDPRLGFVGDVSRINTHVLERQLAEELIPVIATIGVDEDGQAYNVNADTVAGAIAEALGAEKLVYLTNVPGLFGDLHDEESLISQITVKELAELLDSGTLSEGMVPKIRSCVSAHAQRRRPRPPAGRAHPPRPAPGVLYPPGCGHHGGALKCFRGTPPSPRLNRPEELHDASTKLAALDAAHVMQTYARLPVAFVRGEGSRLWDSEGREYLDFLGGLAVTSLGHAHPEIADAVAEQARTLLHVSNLYYNDVQPKLAAELNGLLGGGGKVFFSNSGAEANECAIKLARRYGQKHGIAHTYHIVSALNSFHGRTLTTLAATGQPVKQAAFQPLPPGFWQVPYGDIDALEEQAERFEGKLAAILLEVVQGEGGVWPAPPGYLEAVRALCDRAGALLILDEVQTGLGRTGKLVRLRALRHPARHRDHGQGAGQRRADRRLLGHRRGRRGLRGRRPRHHLRRPAAGRPGRAHDRAGHAAGERARARRPGRRPPGRRCWPTRRAWPPSGASACSWPPNWPRASMPKPSPPPAWNRVWSSTPSPPPRCGSSRRCSSPTTRSTRRWPSSARRWR